jgi:hypothetical protein
VRRAGRLQIGDRRTDAACVVFEKTHGAIAFIAEEPADYSCRVTVIHAKGARGRPFADGARAVLLRQESVVVLQRHPKDDLETKPTARLARSATLSVAKLGIGRVPTPVAGVDLFPILLVIDPIFLEHSRPIFRIFCVSGLINHDHYQPLWRKPRLIPAAKRHWGAARDASVAGCLGRKGASGGYDCVRKLDTVRLTRRSSGERWPLIIASRSCARSSRASGRRRKR